MPSPLMTSVFWDASECPLTVHSAEWSEDDGVLQFRDKIYIPRNSDLQRQVVSLCHDTKVAGYPVHWKTLELVSRNYWWPQMSRYIGQYISTCDVRATGHKTPGEFSVNITVSSYDTTHFQENPQRLGWGSWRDLLHYIHPLVSGLAGSEPN